MPEHPIAPPSLVDFVLRHMRVQASHGTLQDKQDGYAMAPRVLSTYNLIFVTRGQPVWVVNEQEIPLRPGRFVLVYPGIRHRAYCRTRRVTLVSLHLHARLPGGQDVFELLLPPRVQDVHPGKPLDRYLRTMIGEYERFQPNRPGALAGKQVQITLSALAHLIVVELFRNSLASGTLRHRSVEPLVAEVLDELNRRVNEAVTLAELARFAGLSPQHLNRVFGKVLGITPLKYLSRIRMERAAGMLADGRWTIKAVARQVGIDDPYYFSRLFKQQIGQSPAQYRQEMDVRLDSENPS